MVQETTVDRTNWNPTGTVHRATVERDGVRVDVVTMDFYRHEDAVAYMVAAVRHRGEE